MTAAQMLRKLIDPADPAQVTEFYQHFRPTIPMDRALLCLDCESIFEAEGQQKCPACGSTIAWAIGRALNQKRETKPIHDAEPAEDAARPRNGHAREVKLAAEATH